MEKAVLAILKGKMEERQKILAGNMEKGHYALAAHNARQLRDLLCLVLEHEAGEPVIPHKEG